MTDVNMRDTSTKQQLREKLVGKPLVGFDTRHWVKAGSDAAAKGRIGGKSAPARA